MPNERKHPRPGYVTFISVSTFIGATVLLILAVILLVYGTPSDSALKGLDSPAVKACVVAAAVLLDTAAIAMFLGLNWGRMLFYFGCVPILLIIDLFAMLSNPLAIGSIIFRLIILGIYCAALASERSNRFFTGRRTLFKNTQATASSGPGGSDMRRSGRYDY